VLKCVKVNYFRPVANIYVMENVDKLSFSYYILKRALKILPRKSKNVSMLYIDYASLPQEGSDIEIRYRFRNALWYVANDKKTISNKIKFPKPENTNEVKLTVQGLFRKNEYNFRLMSDHILILR
jgi:hypothetical protein